MDFVDKIKQIGNAAVDKGKEIGNAAVNKGLELGNAAKLNIEIMNLESDIEKAKAKIGDIIYQEKIDIKNDAIKENIKTIDRKLNEIKNKKNEINENKK